MKKIRLFDLTRAHNAEFVEFFIHVLIYITLQKATTLGIAGLWSVLNDLFNELDEAFKISRAYESTQQVQEADKQRDKALKFVNQTITANLGNPDRVKRTAAEKLDFIAKKFKKTASTTYYEETALIINFVQELELSVNAPYVAALGLTDGVVALAELNDLFGGLYDNRIEESIAREAIGKVRAHRPKVDTAYRELISAVNSLYEVNELVTKDEAKRTLLDSIIDPINGQIDWLESTITERATRAKNKREKNSAAK